MMGLDLATAVGLAASVAIVGMPHGGLDHLFGQTILEPIIGRWWRPAFTVAYLGVAALVVAGWLVAPNLTLVLFLLIAAYHFGDADGRTGIVGLVEGGAVIWVPILARSEELATILTWVIPGARMDIILVELAWVRPLLWAAAIVFAGHLLTLLARREVWTAARLMVFAVGYSVLPVLVSFGLFFCAWHSVRELAGLAQRANPRRPRRGLVKVIRLAALQAALVVIASAGVAWWLASGRDLTPVVVQVVFLSLSAVAVPHILLHLVANRFGADPFAREKDLCPIAAIT